MPDLLYRRISQLVTNTPAGRKPRLHGVTMEDLGVISDAWLKISAGKVEAYGRGDPPKGFQGLEIDCSNHLVTPGYVDCHTHPVYGGNRSHEFVSRLEGKSYQDIAKDGGGIRSSIIATREASEEHLTAVMTENIQSMIRAGTTTIEAKSGYGQSPEEELRSLRIIAKVSQTTPATIRATCLGLHAMPPEVKDKKEFVHQMTHELLPQVAREGLASWVDAFVEKGYFEPEEAEPYLVQARSLGLGIRLHADEFQPSGATALAARYNAASADHLEHASTADLGALAASGGIGVILPGTSLYSKISYARFEGFRQAGCPLAVATDFNPGSCVFYNMAFVASLAGLYCGVDLPHLVAGVTYVPAKALGLEASKGRLAPGFDGDLIVHKMPRLEDWVADFGRHEPSQVWIEGRPYEPH